MGSDHCSVIIQTEQGITNGSKLFCFEAFWSKQEECKDLVRKCWEKQCDGDVMVKWKKKINDCRS